MRAPQTTREALIAELLGDIGALLDKSETLQSALPAVADNAATKIHLAGEAATNSIKQEADKFREMLSSERKLITEPIREAAKQTQHAADVVDAGARRLAFLSTLLGFIGGALGGLAAGLVVAFVFVG